MKKTVFVISLLFLLLALAACSSSSNSPTGSESTTSLSLEGQLLIGTLKLDSTALSVTADQASELLPLWQTLQSLASSGTAADAEVKAVVNQIKGLMSADQLASITAMDLGAQDLVTAMQEYNSATGSTASTTGSTSQAQLPSGSSRGAPTGGNPGSGNPPSDMGGSAVVASVDASSAGLPQGSASQSSTSTAISTSNQVPSALLNAVVEILKKKIS